MEAVLMKDPVKWGAYLKEARKKRKVTQQHAADRMGSFRVVVYHLERKQISNIKTVFRYLRASGLQMKLIPGNKIMAETILSLSNYADVMRWSRNLYKVTLEEAAEKAGVSVQTILNLEAGNNVSANTVFTLLAYYNMKIEINEKANTSATSASSNRVVDIFQHSGDAADGHAEGSGYSGKDDD